MIMKRYFYYLIVLLFLSAVFTGCNEEDEPNDPFPGDVVEGCYIINYGSFGSGGASISKYDYNADEITNFYYQSQNGGKELLSNIQYGYEYNDQVFLMGNETDQLINLNPLFEQTLNGVTDGIEKPRFCIGEGDYLYISCWGDNPDWTDMPDTYIAKYNIVTNSVEQTIPMPGGPEGLAISNGKLYVALNYVNQVGVVELIDETVSFITTPAASSYFLKDKDGNLYFTMLSTYADPADETGLGLINTTNDSVENMFLLDNVSTSYGSMLQANTGFTKIYLVTSAYDANWNLTGAVHVFDVAGKAFDETPFVSDIAGISGISVNPANNDIYVFAAQSTTGIGLMMIYNQNGDPVKNIEVGASPNGALYLD